MATKKVKTAGLFLVGMVGMLIGAAAVRAQPRVNLELVTEPGFPPAAAHRWMHALQDLRLGNLQIRSAHPGDRPEIRQRGEGASASYRVTGVLTSGNTLRLPGGEFRLGDVNGIRDWLQKLEQGGEQRLRETEAAFGLTPSQLVDVHKALSVPVTFSTEGRRTFDVLNRIAGSLSLSFLADGATQAVLRGDDPVLDELQGLTAGTAVAATLRPLGLVLVPQQQPGGDIRLAILEVRQASESWPVGWPSDRSPRETLPELFHFLNVEIEDTPLSEALEAIGDRLPAPLLYDHNSLARQRIVLADIPVSLDPGRTYYQRILTRLLSQAKLTSELRVDDGGTPFLWISPLLRR